MLQIIKCPSCSAPLEFDGDAIETCDFCGSRVLMTPDVSSVRNENSFGFGALLNQAQKLKEVLNLARAGNKIQAIKLYREITNVGLAEAKDAVERLERGESVNFKNVNFQSYEPAAVKVNTEAVVKTAKVVGGSFVAATVITIILIFGVTLAVIWLVTSAIDKGQQQQQIKSGSSPTSPIVSRTDDTSQFAREILRFGGEGVGAGMFKDNRVVAVDGDGKIYSVDYIGGRIQIFDANGKFLTQWFIDKEFGVFGLAASRDGSTVYVCQRGQISAYEAATGKLLKQTEPYGAYQKIAVNLDGSVTANDRNGGIYRLDKDLKQIAAFKDAAKTAGINNSGGFDYIAVNGLGEIYSASRNGKDICKFSAEGKFLDRFKTKASSANDIAVDPKGRIFVSDTNEIYVYTAEGEFVNQFETQQSFGMAFNDKGEIFVASRPFVVKYELKN